MSSDAQLTSALNIMRRMPPSSTENSLAGLIELVPHLSDDLLNTVDQPLKIQKDTTTGKSFLLCDYNRDGDSYRSPWSNEYFPPTEEGFLPSDRLRAMEIEANQLFDVYRKMYFEGGISSVYFFDMSDGRAGNSFGACFLIHKDVQDLKTIEKGWWDSIHVFEAIDEGKQFEYKLTTTVMVSMNLRDEATGAVDLSGSMTKQETKKLPVNASQTHIANMGGMVEGMELRIRNAIEGIYIQKTREVINGMRHPTGQRDAVWANVAKSLTAAVMNHGAKRVKDSEF